MQTLKIGKVPPHIKRYWEIISQIQEDREKSLIRRQKMINGIFCTKIGLYMLFLGDLLWQMQRDCPLDHGDAEPKR